ncbi:4'-phosphopantetheinyl transferase family protein [Paludibaculum fermentans]|uniref:4'-phosphopantetheinyl transferase family protein n=1 Tax=Paludibaculum fermentans TaxID=1473598 RepID=UPI003EBD8C61
MLRLLKPEEVRDPDVLERFRASLSDDEQARIAKFIFEKDRHVRLVARGSLRQALSEHSGGVPPSEFRFRYNEFGKPFIEQPASLAGVAFNLSHCDGLIAILIAEGSEAGIDVELIRPMTDLFRVAQRFFAPPEVEDLHQTPEPARLERFFQYWTLKESYLKARGIGLSLGLNQFWFELDEGIRIRFSDGFDDAPERWRFHQQRVDPLHWLATAVAS